MDKRAFYRREDVVANYESWRFGSEGGRYVDEQELETMLAMLHELPRAARILDLPCGTGRLLGALSELSFVDLWGADSSPAMLERAALRAPSASLQCLDAFATGLPARSFAAVCSLRFLFHVDRPLTFFAEVARILRPAGLFIFDSIRWTPRGLVSAIDRALGGRLYCYGEREVSAMLAKSGFEVLASQRKFALPSLAYRFLPSLLLRGVRWAEPRLPRQGMTKTFYLARKRS